MVEIIRVRARRRSAVLRRARRCLLRSASRRDPSCARSTPTTSRPGSARSRCSSGSTGAGRPRTARRRAIRACACATRRSPSASAQRDAWLASMLAALDDADAPEVGQSSHAGVLRDGGDRHDQLRARATRGRRVSKRQQKEKHGAAGRRRAPARTSGRRRGAVRAGPALARSRRCRPRSHARRTRPTRPRSSRPSRPTSSPIACAPPAAPAARCCSQSRDAVRVGVTTDELDRICHEACIARGGYPSPLHYKGFPKSLCTSVNEVICHGIPDDRVLEDGDIVNCDVTIFLQRRARRLQRDVPRRRRRRRSAATSCRSPRNRCGRASTRCGPAHRINDIGRAIQDARGGRGLRRRARVRRPRHRRGVPHRAVGAALLRPARRHSDRRRA